ncbi:MAG: heavy-metal-associated domain-containing protein [Myxococcaceae bacterium]
MMKKLFVASLSVFALSSAAFAKETSTTLKVSGWACGSCPEKTAEALKKVDGVKSVKTSVEKGTAEVSYDDSKVKVAQLESAVTSSGFKVAK